MDLLVRDDVFHFKQFDVHQDRCLMKVCTDGVLLGSWVSVKGAESAMDIGTGSGVIALMLAQRSAFLHRITGVEIDEGSYQQACSNAAQSPWSERVEMIHAPIQDYIREAIDRFDLIISNPPFFTGGTLSESQPKNEVRHTVKLPHSDLLRAVKQLMSPKGRFSVILPVMEGYRFVELAEQYRLYLSRRTRVFTRPGKPVERFLLEFSHDQGVLLEEKDLYIHEGRKNDFSSEYVNLTRDFYLKL
ncbi:methyltransferase domain-containing protein [Membranicola marinus]|uniref:tRNA1(Val) (adenine(37)-N6)-methyltransferase n=1 Tax=Membranihabitans marinus TaxID=1227546 RepID=A0A953I1Z1_9BACT|nr:methyltransferase [Membranihabitans marinus]MBY5959807.1 methyltransferase domain-containing protein [Membranihabitans marinus]